MLAIKQQRAGYTIKCIVRMISQEIPMIPHTCTFFFFPQKYQFEKKEAISFSKYCKITL
jgi:hypothetical protein